MLALQNLLDIKALRYKKKDAKSPKMSVYTQNRMAMKDISSKVQIFETS